MIVLIYFIGVVVSFFTFIYHERTTDDPVIAYDNDDVYAPEIMVAYLALSSLWAVLLPLFTVCYVLEKIRIIIIAIIETFIQIKNLNKVEKGCETNES